MSNKHTELSKIKFINREPDNKEWTANIGLLNKWVEPENYLRAIIQYARSGEFFPADMHVDLIEQLITSHVEEKVREAMIQSAIQRISNTLEKTYPEVKWDRYSGYLDDLTVFGWLERKDNYKDYVELTFKHGYLNSTSTSSAEMSEEISNRGGFTHSSCNRVEDTFDIKNSIKLQLPEKEDS